MSCDQTDGTSWAYRTGYSNYWTYSGSTGGALGNHKHSITLSGNTTNNSGNSGSETRPSNMTIKIWVRTA